MACVFIPPEIRELTGGRETIEVAGRTVRDVIENLDAQFPGLKDRLCDGDALRPGLAVAVGTSVSAAGLRHRVERDTEIHFLPAIGGG